MGVAPAMIRTKLIILAVMATLTGLLAVRVWRLEQRSTAMHSVASAQLQLMQQQLEKARAHQRDTQANLELSAALFACNSDEDSAASVERDPCRLVCWSIQNDDQVHYTERLSEAVCERLP